MGIASDQASAHAEYTSRLAARGAEAERRARHASSASHLRLLVFVTGVLAAWFVFGIRALGPVWLVALALLFVALVVIHDRLLTRRDRARRSVAFYESGLARLEDRWMGQGEPGERYRDSDHPYAEDLDLFGAGSLFELLCTARTRSGEDILADWLRGPADPPTILARQHAVEELREGLDLREDLARLGDEARSGMHPEALRAWGMGEVHLAGRAPAWIAAALSFSTVFGLVGWIATPLPPITFVGPLLAEAVFAVIYRRRVAEVVRRMELPGRELGLFADLLGRLERESFQSQRLSELRSSLDTDGVSPSSRIARLRLLIDLLDARRNQVFLPFAASVLWTTQLAFAIERWRDVCGPALGRWIDAVGEIEALEAFAGFAYENPDHPFPEVEDAAPRFEGEGLGHPMLPARRCVRNDVVLGTRQLLVISGSNMSGKSTLLRTVGTNAVLGLAGAPVCAVRLRLSPLSVGASIRIQDSLLEGNSRFYAEILRLRQITEIARGEPPALFLLDEILHGTNSHDRGIGAAAVVRSLISAGAIGLVTTHDLALAQVADDLAPTAANVHFQDHMENGEIAFDYRMHDGVVTKSNALELMRAVGLDV